MYEWRVDGLDVSDREEFTHSFNETDEYDVMLVVQDEAGRSDSMTRPVRAGYEPRED